jgi:hypothetical protein
MGTALLPMGPATISAGFMRKITGIHVSPIYDATGAELALRTNLSVKRSLGSRYEALRAERLDEAWSKSACRSVTKCADAMRRWRRWRWKSYLSKALLLSPSPITVALRVGGILHAVVVSRILNREAMDSPLVILIHVS